MCTDLNVHGDPEAKVMRKIFVYNIPTNATLDEVKFFFEKFGEIEVQKFNKNLANFNLKNSVRLNLKHET
mgnify:FL=1